MVDDKLSEKCCKQTNNEGENMIETRVESFDMGKRVRNHTLATTGIVLATYILIYTAIQKSEVSMIISWKNNYEKWQ